MTETTPAPASAPPQSSYFRKHWNGELSLARTFWVNIFAVNVALWGISKIPSLPPINDLAPVTAFVTFLALIGLLSALSIWQVVGLWRSASAYRAQKKAENKGAGWAFASYTVCIVFVLSFVMQTVLFVVPTTVQLAQIAGGDTEYDDFAMRLLNPHELEVMGGLGHGSADKVKVMLDANPDVAIVHLNSRGGRLEEGYKLHDIIKSQGLSTITKSGCESACTLAFLAGKERYLSSSAGLGFHAPSGPYASLQDVTKTRVRMIDLAVANGVVQDFAAEVYFYNEDDAWYPEHADLLKSNFATGYSSGQFAVSGLGAEPKLEDIAKQGFGEDFDKALRATDAETYNALLAEIHEGILTGKPQNVVYGSVASVMEAIALKRLPYASQKSLSDLGDHFAAQLAFLNANDVNSCMQFLGLPMEGPASISGFPPHFSINRMNIWQDIITSSVGAEKHPVDPTHVNTVTDKVYDLLLQTENGKTAATTLGDIEGTPSAAKRCQAFSLFYDAVSKLDATDKAAFVQDTFSDEG